MKGDEVTPLEVRPRFSNDLHANIRLVRGTLADAGEIADAEEFVHLAYLLVTELEAGRLEEHPVTTAARKVGAAVHWVP